MSDILPQTNKEFPEHAVVLTGGKNRLKTAINLLKEKKVSHLLVSGINNRISPDRFYKIFLLSEYKDKITLGYKACNTSQNALEVSAWFLCNKKIKKILLITNKEHMVRSMFEIKNKNPKILITPYSVNQNVELKYLILEYAKYVYALLRNTTFL